MVPKNVVVLVIFAIVVALGGEISSAGELRGRCEAVPDGDTVHVVGENGLIVINLREINAPELGQPFGEKARAFLEELVLGQEVSVVLFSAVSDGAVEGRILLGGVDAGRQMLEAGLAWTGNTSDEGLIIAGLTARGAKRGLWAQEKPVPPWTWCEKKVDAPVKPRPVKRSLSDVAGEIELERNADGRTVIAGLAPKSSGSRQAAEGSSLDDDGNYHLDFDCPEDGLAGCVGARFTASYTEFYETEPGIYSVNSLDLGEGKHQFLFRGRSWGVGVNCTCEDDDACACSIDLAPRKE